MRIVTLFLGIVAAICVAGCGAADKGVDAVGNQFERGITGQGQIVPNQPTSDSFGSEYN